MVVGPIVISDGGARTGNPVISAGDNLHAGVLEFDPSSGAFCAYAYRANHEPPPGGPQGTIAGAVRDQYGAPIANATVTVQTTAMATTRTNGTCAVNVPVRTYGVTGAKTFYVSQTLPAAAVSESQTTAAHFTITGQPPDPVTSSQADPRDRAVYL